MVGIDDQQFDLERDRDGPHEVARTCLVCVDALLDALHALHRSEPGFHDDWFHHEPLNSWEAGGGYGSHFSITQIIAWIQSNLFKTTTRQNYPGVLLIYVL